MAKPLDSSLGFWLEFQSFANQTLAEALKRHSPHISTAEFEAALAQGQLSINGQPAKTNPLLQIGDRVSCYLPEHFEEQVDTHWLPLWENDELLALYKPAQLPVSRTTRNLYNTLIALVRRHTPFVDAHLLHRLDAETSGVILLAKNAAADKKFKPRLKELLATKIYHALVWGNPSWDELKAEHYLVERPDSPIRSQMHIVDAATPLQGKAPKLASSQFKVLKRFAGHSLVECRLNTGRRHQLRAQLSHLGHAIIGDKIYSQHGHYYLKRLEHELTATELNELGAPHQLLHAQELVLSLNGQEQHISAPHYPQAWQSYLSAK